MQGDQDNQEYDMMEEIILTAVASLMFALPVGAQKSMPNTAGLRRGHLQATF